DNLSVVQEEPIISPNIKENTILKSEESIPEMKQNLQYEGENINDLEKSGVKTINLLKAASPNVNERVKFNIPLLDATPLKLVLEQLGAIKIKDNLYSIYEQEISLKDNKWYNKTQKKGYVNSISLLK